MDRIKKLKKRKLTKRKVIVFIALITILIGIIYGIFKLINSLIPVKNISKDNISIKLSTTKQTGNSVISEITTKTKYDIFYYIDYSAGEEQYYEDDEYSEDIEEISEYDNEVSNTTNTSNTANTVNTTNSVNNYSNTSNNSVNNASSSKSNSKKLDIKNIGDKEYKKLKNSKLEIENNGIVYLKYSRFGKLSNVPYVFEISNIDKDGPEIGDIITNSTYTSITVTANAIDKNMSNLQYYFKLSTSNNYIATGSSNSYTFNDLTTNESYIIYVKVADKFGNESEAVTEAIASIDNEEDEVVEQKIYHIEVNLGANTVTVYEKDDNGKFTNPVKAFICSTGKSTPKSGTYKISNKYRWRSLFGGVYGQYAVRIHGNILFHSVPYKKMAPNTLEYDEFDKLGTSASMGCIRLCVKDAKWIYDNVKSGSTVKFYSDSSNPGPLGKPTAQKISNNKVNRNWDPTDPDKHNPWLGGDGIPNKVTFVEESSSNIITNQIKNTTSNSVQNTVTNTTSNTTNTITNSTSTQEPETPSEKPVQNQTIPDTPSNTITEEQPQTKPPENIPTPPDDIEVDNNNDNDEETTNTTVEPPVTQPETNTTIEPEENEVETPEVDNTTVVSNETAN